MNAGYERLTMTIVKKPHASRKQTTIAFIEAYGTINLRWLCPSLQNALAFILNDSLSGEDYEGTVRPALVQKMERSRRSECMRHSRWTWPWWRRGPRLDVKTVDYGSPPIWLF